MRWDRFLFRVSSGGPGRFADRFAGAERRAHLEECRRVGCPAGIMIDDASGDMPSSCRIRGSANWGSLLDERGLQAAF